MRTNRVIFFIILTMVSCLPDVGLGDEMKFDGKIWKETDKEGGERHMMLDDLIENYLYSGIHKDSLISMLGKPDSSSKDKLYYLISIGYDPCFLELELNEEILSKYKEVCH